MAERYGLFTTFRTQPGKADDFLGLLARASAAMGTNEHCQSYVVSKDSAERDCVRVFEVWDSKAAHDDSLQDPRALEFIKQGLSLIAGNPDSIELRVVAGAD